MKIHFFKHSSDIYPRKSCVWDGVEKCEPFPSLSNLLKNLLHILTSLFSLVAIFAIYTYNHDIISPLFFFHLVVLAVFLPLHELCHVLYLLIIGQKPEGIYFFTYGILHSLTKFQAPTAYVVPDFSIHSRLQRLLFSAFPLLIMTVLPAVIGILVPFIAPYCFILAITNFDCSIFDICDMLCFSKCPRESLYFYPFGIIIPSSDTLIFRTISKKNGSDILIKRQFIYQNKRLTEVPFEHSDSSRVLEQEFIIQFILDEK